MANSDNLHINYRVISPTADIRGGARLVMKRLLNGTDLDVSSQWVVVKTNGTISVHPLNAPSIWSKRTCRLTDILSTFITIVDQ